MNSVRVFYLTRKFGGDGLTEKRIRQKLVRAGGKMVYLRRGRGALFGYVCCFKI